MLLQILVLSADISKAVFEKFWKTASEIPPAEPSEAIFVKWPRMIFQLTHLKPYLKNGVGGPPSWPIGSHIWKTQLTHWRPFLKNCLGRPTGWPVKGRFWKMVSEVLLADPAEAVFEKWPRRSYRLTRQRLFLKNGLGCLTGWPVRNRFWKMASEVWPADPSEAVFEKWPRRSDRLTPPRPADTQTHLAQGMGADTQTIYFNT